MQMTDEEIIRSFKEAKNPKAQIGILADLNACSRKEIEAIIGRNRLDGINEIKQPEKSAEEKNVRRGRKPGKLPGHENDESLVERAIEKFESEGKTASVGEFLKETGISIYYLRKTNAYQEYVKKKTSVKASAKEEVGKVENPKPVHNEEIEVEPEKPVEENNQTEAEPKKDEHQSEQGHQDRCEGCDSGDCDDCIDFEGLCVDCLGCAERMAKRILLTGAVAIAVTSTLVAALIIKGKKKRK